MQALVTVHPSFLLRVPGDARAHAFAGFVQDLKIAAPFAGNSSG
jgi:hypothetical protein